MSDDTNALLRAVLAGQRELREQIRDLSERVERTRPAISTATVDLARAIHDCIGIYSFPSSQLVSYAAMPERKALRDAIIAAVGELNAHSLGKLLGAVVGRDLGGLVVHRDGKDRGVAIWSIKDRGDEGMDPSSLRPPPK